MNLEHMSLEALVQSVANATSVTRSVQVHDLKAEIGMRLEGLRRHAEGHDGMMRLLNGEPLSFVQLLDQIMDAMDAAGVADSQARSIEAAENEPNRARAYDLRAMLEERLERLREAPHHAGAVSIMDGRA